MASSPTASDQGPLLTSSHTKGSLGRAAGWAAAAILSVACAFHLYWALGGSWAAATAYGDTDLPPRGLVALVAVLIAAAVLIVLARIGALGMRLSNRLLGWGTWAFAVAFALASIGNLTAPQGTYARAWHVFFFGPLLLILAVLCALAARSPTPAPRRR